MALRVLLADDHLVVRQGLKALLERHGFQVVGEASNGLEAVRLVEKLKPRVAVLDLAMPVMNGVEAVRQIARASPSTKTILLTMYREEQYVLQALEAGVAGYVLKTKAAEDLVHAIQQVAHGMVSLSPEISQTVVEAYRTNMRPASQTLTSRERQVVQLVAEGKTTKEIASHLGISVKTADSHRTRVMKKLDIHDTAGLVRYAVRTGLIQL
jgi:two-component system, NarL family, response regulator NreC